MNVCGPKGLRAAVKVCDVHWNEILWAIKWHYCRHWYHNGVHVISASDKEYLQLVPSKAMLCRPSWSSRVAAGNHTEMNTNCMQENCSCSMSWGVTLCGTRNFVTLFWRAHNISLADESSSCRICFIKKKKRSKAIPVTKIYLILLAAHGGTR
jgi:hypothetical protein